MRTYPANSPQAAARIVALTLVSDGNVSKAELDVLDRVGAHQQLGLSRDQMLEVLQDFCEDLLQDRQSDWSDACQLDPATLQSLMAEVTDPVLRLLVIQLCVAVVDADDHVSEGESIVLVAAVEHWGLEHYMLQPT